MKKVIICLVVIVLSSANSFAQTTKITAAELPEYIVITAESKEEADKLFNELSVGGQIEMPIADSPWGSYFGMFRDKYGIEWMVDFDPKYNRQK